MDSINKKYSFYISVSVAIISLFCAKLGLADDWQIQHIGPGAGTAIQIGVIDPLDENIYYIGGDSSGVLRTLDGGQTWETVNEGLITPSDAYYAPYFILELEITPSNPETLYAGTLSGIYRSDNRANSWRKLDLSSVIAGAADESYFIPIGSIEVDPFDSNIIYAGFGDNYGHDNGQGLLFKSSDGGENWSRIGEGIIPSTAIVYGIALDPTGPADTRRLIISTNQGVFRSDDGGVTIQRFEQGLPHIRGRRIDVGLSTNGTAVFYLVLFTEGDSESSWRGGIYKWTVGESGWIEANGINDSGLPKFDEGPFTYNWLAVAPNDSNIVFLSTAGEGENLGGDDFLFASEDGGQTWEERIESWDNGWYSWYPGFDFLALSPSNPEVLIGESWGVNKSLDSGANWFQTHTNIHAGEPRTFSGRGNIEIMWVLSLAVDPRPEFADRLYVGYADTLLFITENMSTFHRLHALPANDPINDFAEGWGDSVDLTPQVTLDPENPDTLYTSASFRLWKSTDTGESWTELTGWPEPDYVNRDEVVRFSIDPGSPVQSRSILATVHTVGVFKTNDGGENWTSLNSNIGESAPTLSGVFRDPTNSQRVYLGNFSLAWYSQSDPYGLKNFYRSLDGGTTWEAIGPLPTIRELWIDPDDGNHLLAATSDLSAEADNLGGIYRSFDGGDHWTRVLAQSAVSSIALDPHHNDTLWSLVTADYTYFPDMQAGLYKSIDRGLTWIRQEIPDLNFYGLHPLLIHPTRANDIFIGTAGNGLIRLLRTDSGDGVSPTPTPTDSKVSNWYGY